MEKLINRFLEYVSYDTASDYYSDSSPSTASQKVFARVLEKECIKLGFDSVCLTDAGYLYCFLKGKGRAAKKRVGFIAHMDTSPDFCGSGVSPVIVRQYDGGDIKLNESVTISPERFPSLNDYIGEDLITTGGTTLLGADDKAGIAEIMTAVEELINSGEERPDICVAFTPDEEIGRGMDKFDLELFKPDYAYTVDGGGRGELEFECFNAARADLHIKGEAVHPGYAKGIMRNAVLIAAELIEALPKKQIPAETEGYEGFFHVSRLRAEVSEAEISLIIRDFDKTVFSERKELLLDIVKKMNRVYNECISVEIHDEYFNMGDILSEKKEAVDIAKAACEAVGIEPVIRPVRGGTDGSRLTYMGIPCPNIFAGGHNFHGPYEYIPVNSMRYAVSVIRQIIRFYVNY